uniref:Uncharacterized protein n=1 Tax=Knipowitschia caucasica TaxID=637954 RepID=A0AAV2KHE0_KNICA
MGAQKRRAGFGLRGVRHVVQHLSLSNSSQPEHLCSALAVHSSDSWFDKTPAQSCPAPANSRIRNVHLICQEDPPQRATIIRDPARSQSNTRIGAA